MGGARIYTRDTTHTNVPNQEWVPSPEWIRNAIEQMLSQLKGLRRVIEDRTRPVDEYQGTPTASELQSTVTVPAQFDAQMSERIESILIWGPPAATGTIKLGDTTINIVIPASGVLVIAPISMLLNRSDDRILTLSPAGDIGVRLMGWADERY